MVGAAAVVCVVVVTVPVPPPPPQPHKNAQAKTTAASIVAPGFIAVHLHCAGQAMLILLQP